MDTGLVIASDVRWAFQANSGAPATAQVVTSLTAADRPEPVMWNTAENDLLTRVAGGDTDAFSEMYDRFAAAARLPSYSTSKIQPTVSCPTRPLLWAATTLPPIRS